MLGFHGWDLLFILLIVVLIFGARRLPELGSSLGKGLNALKSGLNNQEEKVTVEEVEDTKDQKRV
jgi:sec-independent protein translocase protein TatA